MSDFTPHVNDKYPIGPGCTVRAATFGNPPGLPYLLPQGWVPVLSQDGTEVTLQRIDGKACPECHIDAAFPKHFQKA